MRKITIVNQVQGIEAELPAVVGALQAQISGDFARAWGADALLEVAASTNERGLSGSDGIVYVSDAYEADRSGLPPPAAFHRDHHGGVPAGFVFPVLADRTPTGWTVALSHEILEMIVDPDLNLLVAGPHPLKKNAGQVLRPYEICDPVQASVYTIDGVRVADFVTPAYFRDLPRDHSKAAPTHHEKDALGPFEILPGGYFNYFDFELGTWREFRGPPDKASSAHAEAWLAARVATPRTQRVFRRLTQGNVEDGFDGPPQHQWPGDGQRNW